MTEVAPTLADAIRSKAVGQLRAENAKWRRRCRDVERERDDLRDERDALVRALARTAKADRTET